MPTAELNAITAGEVHSGLFADGKRHGRAHVTYANGDEIDAEWAADECVRGVYKYSAGAVYDGTFGVGDKPAHPGGPSPCVERHGTGTLRWVWRRYRDSGTVCSTESVQR